MADRIISMRTLLRERLEQLANPHRWGSTTAWLLCRRMVGVHARVLDVLRYPQGRRLWLVASGCRFSQLQSLCLPPPPPPHPACSWQHITDQIGM
jgi:hypothetical protein